MGIHGLWEELSPAAERIALSKLAADKWESENGRCLRVAIDTSIWAFQVQSGKKGSNPALRTFYYRLCRLLRSNVEPLFIFDGPQKPPFKRNQRTAFLGETFETQQLKALINAFGFMSWDAPGEAEAECALFEKLGVVDIVITEDVDCLMFGAKRVGREMKDKRRSHVDLYSNVEEVIGVNRDGLVLVAMMSGGDYLPAGIANCGPKIAVEIARAGFATSLMTTGDYQSWREELATELSTNSEKTFTRRQPALAKRILESTFPDPTILSYYSRPVISSEERVSAFVPQWRKPDIPVLAELCRKLFEWDSRWGMVRFMRSITPGLLLYTVIHRNTNTSTTDKSPSRPKSTGKLTDYFKSTKSSTPSTVKNNSDFIAIHGTRKHASTDTLEELRLSYIPSNLQPYLTLNFDLTQYTHPTPPSQEKRPKESSDSKDSSDEEFEVFGGREAKWSPDEVQRIWIPKVYVERGYPKKFAEWERSEMVRKSPKKGKKVTQVGAMDQFVRREPDIRKMEIVGVMEDKSSVRKSPVRKSVERKENIKSPTRTTRKENIISSQSIITRRKEKIVSSSTKKVNSSTTKISNIITPSKPDSVTSTITWNIPSDSDSDSLPSPTNMLSYTSKTSITKKTIEDGSPMKVSGNFVGVFRESLGGTLYEIEDT